MPFNRSFIDFLPYPVYNNTCEYKMLKDVEEHGAKEGRQLCGSLA